MEIINLSGASSVKIYTTTGKFVWKEIGDLDWNRKEFQKNQPIFT